MGIWKGVLAFWMKAKKAWNLGRFIHYYTTSSPSSRARARGTKWPHERSRSQIPDGHFPPRSFCELRERGTDRILIHYTIIMATFNSIFDLENVCTFF